MAHLMLPAVTALPAIATAARSTKHHNWRLELFFKSHEELQRQLPFLQKHGIRKVNLTNKTDKDDLLASVKLLQTAIPDLDVCVHYSIKYNYDRTPSGASQRLQSFCSQLQQHRLDFARLSTHAEASHPQLTGHILLVSGGGKKKAFNTVTALQQLAASKKQKLQGGLAVSSDGNTWQQPQQVQEQVDSSVTNGGGAGHASGPGQLEKGPSARSRKRPAASEVRPGMSVGSSGSQLPSLAVAFNPYLADERDAQVERIRLREKLATGLVDRIYLQMGTDLHRLSSGLQYLQQLTQGGLCEPPQLLGSVFLPSKRLLAQMKFRPWNGVFLSDEYLSSVEAAEAITTKILSVYSDAGVVPLVESAVTTDSDMLRLQALLGSSKAQKLSADSGLEFA